MTPKKYLERVKKVKAAMKLLEPKQRRTLAWQMLLKETIRKDKEGLKWLKDHYNTFIKNSEGDFI